MEQYTDCKESSEETVKKEISLEGRSEKEIGCGANEIIKWTGVLNSQEKDTSWLSY